MILLYRRHLYISSNSVLFYLVSHTYFAQVGASDVKSFLSSYSSPIFYARSNPFVCGIIVIRLFICVILSVALVDGSLPNSRGSLSILPQGKIPPGYHSSVKPSKTSLCHSFLLLFLFLYSPRVFSRPICL